MARERVFRSDARVVRHQHPPHSSRPQTTSQLLAEDFRLPNSPTNRPTNLKILILMVAPLRRLDHVGENQRQKFVLKQEREGEIKNFLINFVMLALEKYLFAFNGVKRHKTYRYREEAKRLMALITVQF